jgi:molecular chaperone DnaJ
MKDYYTILGVARDSSQAEIKKAYRALALQYHPDRNNGSAVSEERFKEITESYIILGDVPKRNAYDFAHNNRRYHWKQDNTPPGQATPVTFLLLFKRIKTRVLNTGGYINEYALFKVIDDLLSEETIALLRKANDAGTNNLILDEILVSCVFLPYESRVAIHDKLVKLAGGDLVFMQKLAVLNKKGDSSKYKGQATGAVKSEANRPAFFFILLIIFIIVLMMVSS